MNDFSAIRAVSIGYTDWQGRSTRLYCDRHFRFLDATGLCPHCQRDAEVGAVERARVEQARQAAVAAESADRAEMWGL